MQQTGFGMRAAAVFLTSVVMFAAVIVIAHSLQMTTAVTPFRPAGGRDLTGDEPSDGDLTQTDTKVDLGPVRQVGTLPAVTAQPVPVPTVTAQPVPVPAVTATPLPDSDVAIVGAGGRPTSSGGGTSAPGAPANLPHGVDAPGSDPRPVVEEPPPAAGPGSPAAPQPTPEPAPPQPAPAPSASESESVAPESIVGSEPAVIGDAASEAPSEQ